MVVGVSGRGLPEVRQASVGEAESILHCFEWLFEPPGAVAPGWSREAGLERLKRALSDGNTAIFLAEDADAVVGLCSAYLDIESIRYGLRCWVEDLVVAPHQRSSGTGALLFDAARHWSAKRGATHLELDSGMARVDAHRFYERRDPDWTGMQYAWKL